MTIHCPSCENPCSEAAEACPKCGHPFKSPAPSTATAVSVPRTGIGCPRCGSSEIKQKKHTKGSGWALAVLGLVLAPFTLGLTLLMCLAALFLSEKRGRCLSCKWTWTT